MSPYQISDVYIQPFIGYRQPTESYIFARLPCCLYPYSKKNINESYNIFRGVMFILYSRILQWRCCPCRLTSSHICHVVSTGYGTSKLRHCGVLKGIAFIKNFVRIGRMDLTSRWERGDLQKSLWSHKLIFFSLRRKYVKKSHGDIECDVLD